ncbi:formaldehyde dehydrogenase, glutathione-independent, partial [Oceanobacillus caeni]
GFAKAHTFVTGQTPVMKYNHDLMKAILSGRAQIAKAVNATVISIDDAPNGYKQFDGGVSRKFVIDPHNLIK